MNRKDVDIIGSTAKVSFPELGLLDVPAKTDTGADSSSIWASNVQVTPKGLQFTLFGPGSHYYSGEPIVVGAYRTASVKNSSGEAEFRYKVRLLLKVGPRSVRAWFSLADRGGMRYPVLLGRRLLKNKFVVDVSKKTLSHGSKQSTKRVLILASDSQGLAQFAKEVTAQMSVKAEIAARSFADLSFDLKTGNVTVRDMVAGRDIADYDVVYFKSHKNNYELAVAAAQYLAFNHVPFFDRELLNHVSYDKLSEMILLAMHDLPVPDSFCATSQVLKAQFAQLTEQLGTPLVCKEINSDRGRKNYLIANKQELEKVLASADANDIYMLQRYIPNDGYQRLYVFGNNVGPVIHRQALEEYRPLKSHLNNRSHSGNARLLAEDEISSEVRDLVIRASKLMSRQITGVDIIQDKHTKQWYILEVNNAPQVKTGSYLAEKRVALARFLDFELNR